jgi:ATP-dependent helicase/nuclease subunit B
VAQAIAGDSRLLAGYFSHEATRSVGNAIDAGLRTVHSRARRDSFGPAEGLLTSPAAAARLAARYGPKHLWSPSRWETYASCPYKFFLETVLKLEPLGDLVLETDFARRGSRLHDVLAEFHRRWQSARRERSIESEHEAAAFAEHLRNVVDERIVAPRAGIEAALLELDRRQILKWADRHFEHHARYQAHWSELAAPLEPAHFELRFGPKRSGDDDAEDPHSSCDPFSLDVDGEPVLITGRIDRIDVARVEGQIVFNVIDYKSGRKPSLKEEHVVSGEHLQLPIYVAAAQALVFGGGAEPLAAGYWTMEGGFDSKGVLAVRQGEDGGESRERIRTAVVECVRQFITSIRRGEFPVFSRDDQCTSRCHFNTVCRIAQVRSLGKTWPPEERGDCLTATRSEAAAATERSGAR